jgi:2-iminobutanoate/2-iminopropanoate deaminase
MKRIIYTEKAPAAIGPYSQAVEIDNWLYISGQIPMDPQSLEIPEKIEDQAEQVMSNIGAILNEAGYDYNDVVKSTIFLVDIEDFKAVNEIYERYYPKDSPARSTVQVAKLPKGAKIEIETIAVR